MLVIFVHGWSVTNTSTYGGLPKALLNQIASKLSIKVHHLYLAKYISFSDEVKIDDIARGMEHAIQNEVIPKLSKGERFACITHSTGALVVRTWIQDFYSQSLENSRLSHLIMLAPANHGSALAQLGKGKLSRMKHFTQGVEPGVGVLDWLELGSDQSWKLNLEWLDLDCTSAGLYTFVLTGQRIDRKIYDNLNSYTDESGSDGVVRVAAANLNYGLVKLTQHGSNLELTKDKRSSRSAMGVLPGLAHSGDEIGILASVKADDPGTHPTLDNVLKCLSVKSKSGYEQLTKVLNKLTDETQSNERIENTSSLFLVKRTFETRRYCMLIIKISDDRGNDLSDYDIIFTAGPHYDPNHLPHGFFVDRQRNQLNPGKLTYYINYDVMHEGLNNPEVQGKFGFRIAARPSEGFAYYTVAEHRGNIGALSKYFAPNQTLMIDVQLHRHVTDGVFSLTSDLAPKSFKESAKGVDI